MARSFRAKLRADCYGKSNVPLALSYITSKEGMRTQYVGVEDSQYLTMCNMVDEPQELSFVFLKNIGDDNAMVYRIVVSGGSYNNKVVGVTSRGYVYAYDNSDCEWYMTSEGNTTLKDEDLSSGVQVYLKNTSTWKALEAYSKHSLAGDAFWSYISPAKADGRLLFTLDITRFE